MTTYDFESGAPGNAATTGNTGASAVVPGSGNAITIDSVGAISGSNSLAFTVAGTTSCWCEFAAESGISTLESVYVPITLSSDGYNSSGGSTTLWQGFLADNTTTVARISITNAGALTVSDQGTAHTGTLAADVTAKYGQTIAVRLQLNTGTTSSNGVITARYYADPVAAVGSYTGSEYTASNWNLGAGASWGKQRVGINSGQASNGANGRKTRIDYYTPVAGTSWVAPPAAATAPTANAGSDIYGQAGTTLTVNGSGTIGTGGGAITGYTWAVAGKARPDMATPTIVSPNSSSSDITGLDQGWYDITLVVTQTGGGLSSTADTVRIWAYAPSGVAVKPVQVTKQTGITREGTATTDEIALSDNDLTTLLRWPDTPTGQEVTIRWGPCGPSTPLLSFDGAKVGSGTVTRTINHYWEDGTTLLDGPYTAILGAQGTISAGLSPTAVTAIGTTLANRRQLVTKISDVAS